MKIYLKLQKTLIGNVSMISANVITVNEINSSIAIEIQEEINKEKNNSFKIKLGSITGTKFLAGRGPDIKIKIETVRKFRYRFKVGIRRKRNKPDFAQNVFRSKMYNNNTYSL